MSRRGFRLHPNLLPLEGRLTPAIITVFNTLDAGPGSLRQAVLDANASKLTADTIVFDTLAERLGDVRSGRWERRAGDSWHARLLDTVRA